MVGFLKNIKHFIFFLTARGYQILFISFSIMLEHVKSVQIAIRFPISVIDAEAN